MKIKLFCVLVLVLGIFVFISPKTSNAAMPLPFGGTIIVAQQCNNGMLLTIKEPFSVGQYMWFTGNLPYLMHTPPRVDQIVLGLASAAFTPCAIGKVVVGKGKPILFHGSNI